MERLLGKIVIKGKLQLLTGMHIGSSSDFSSIGAVDSVIIRDPVTKKPIIPGSTMKGKMRALLGKVEGVYNCKLDEGRESDKIKELFGTAGKGKNQKIYEGKLQFIDLFINDESVKKLEKAASDLYLTEIKFENTIDRVTGIANPRQIERVPAGATFDFKMVYNLHEDGKHKRDFETIQKGLALLQLDYIGGSGTRGYGRVNFTELSAEKLDFNANTVDMVELNKLLEGVYENELLHI